MKCPEVRRYLYAFTDDALEVKDNLEVLAHVNMCPACAARVDADEQIKKRMYAVFAAEATPAGLEARIRKALKSEANPRRSSILFRLAPVAAAAAAIGLIAFVWMMSTGARTSGNVDGSPIELAADAPPTVLAVAAEFRDGHLKCSKIGPSHHLAGIDRDLPVMRKQLSKRLNVSVIAPDWRHEELRFVSACTCGIPHGLTGAHLVYENPHVRAVSLYCLKPSEQFDTFGEEDVFGETYRVAHADGMNLVAWNNRSTDYLICTNGEFGDCDSLIRTLVHPVRVALGETADPMDVKLAFVDAMSLVQWSPAE